MEKRILLADDHWVTRGGTKTILQTALGFTNVGEAHDCHSIMKELAKKNYTHGVFDLLMPDGNTIELFPNIRALYPKLRILVFSMHPLAPYRPILEKYKICHFISKRAGADETISELKAFLYDETHWLKQQSIGAYKDPLGGLTERELLVLTYLLAGITVNQIAQKMNISPSAVSNFKVKIFKKTGTTNLMELQKLATIAQFLTLFDHW